MACFIRYAVIVLATVLCSFSVIAANRTVIVEPSQLQRTWSKGQGPFAYSDSRNWGATISTQSGNIKVPVTTTRGFSSTKVAGMVKNLLKLHPGKLALTSAGAYLLTKVPGSSFDPTTGQPMFSEGDGTPMSYPPAPNEFGWAVFGDSRRLSTPELACRTVYPVGTSLLHQNSNPPTHFPVSSYIITGSSETSVTCHLMPSNTALGSLQSRTVLRTGTVCPPGGVYSSSHRTCVGSAPPIPFTDAQYDAVAPSDLDLPLNIWNDLAPIIDSNLPGSFDYPDSFDFTGPSSLTGSPTYTTTLDNVTGTTTSSTTTPTYNFDYSTNPLSITTTTTNVTNNYQNGQHTSTTTTTQGSTENPVETTTTEVPTDCAFMPTVCAFIDWVKSPFDEQEPDLSQFINDEDFEREFNMPGNATCPAPMIISTSKGGYEFSWEPACQWAGLVKPFIIIGALILAIMINLGSFRRD